MAMYALVVKNLGLNLGGLWNTSPGLLNEVLIIHMTGKHA